MQTIDLETSIRDFLTLGRQLQSSHPLTGEHVLKDLTAWYKTSRIIGTSLIDQGDMLLLQWGVIRPLNIIEPTDLRGVSDDEIRFSDSKFQYLNFTRQVFANYDDKEAEFDDLALQMRITLCYESTIEENNGDGIWIETPSEVESGEEKFLSIPFVNLLMKNPASLVEIIVDYCG